MPKPHLMQSRGLLWLVVSLLAVVATSAETQDPGCPAYPASTRIEAARILSLQQQYAALRRTVHPAAIVTPPSRNFIDDWIFKKMSADAVAPAPL